VDDVHKRQEINCNTHIVLRETYIGSSFLHFKHNVDWTSYLKWENR